MDKQAVIRFDLSENEDLDKRNGSIWGGFNQHIQTHLLFSPQAGDLT